MKRESYDSYQPTSPPCIVQLLSFSWALNTGTSPTSRSVRWKGKHPMYIYSKQLKNKLQVFSDVDLKVSPFNLYIYILYIYINRSGSKQYHWKQNHDVETSLMKQNTKSTVRYMGVSKNRGTPQIIHFNRVFHYKPSILGYPIFGNTHMLQSWCIDCSGQLPEPNFAHIAAWVETHLQKRWICSIEFLCPKPETNGKSPWKSMVGRWMSFWDGLFWEAMLVSGSLSWIIMDSFVDWTYMGKWGMGCRTYSIENVSLTCHLLHIFDI